MTYESVIPTFLVTKQWKKPIAFILAVAVYIFCWHAQIKSTALRG